MSLKRKWLKIIAWILPALFVATAVSATTGVFRTDLFGNIVSGRSTVLLAVGEASNCKLSISGSTLSVVGSDGAALSATNRCNVGVTDSVVATLTAPVSVTFGASSDTDGNLFGLVDANWAQVMPWALSVVTDGTSSYFAISRIPDSVTGSSAAGLCQKGDTDCDSPNDVMILATGLTLADWTNKAMTPVGWFYGTYATTGSAWTFTTDTTTGFNENVSGKRFHFVMGQMNASSGTFLIPNGGTAAVFSVNNFDYSIDFNTKTATYWIDIEGDGGTDGAGAASATRLSMPYPFEDGVIPFYGTFAIYGAGITRALFYGQAVSGQAYIQFLTVSDGANIMNSGFSNGGRIIIGSWSHPIYQW